MKKIPEMNLPKISKNWRKKIGEMMDVGFAHRSLSEGEIL